MKKLLLALTAIITFQISFGQTPTIRDYFIPEAGKNEVSFYNSTMPEASRKIIYNDDDKGYQDISTYKGYVVGTNKYYIEISPNEVNVIGVENWSAVTTPATTETSYDSNFILKMPEPGKTISWFYLDGNMKLKCTASWTTVTYNEERRKAIKLVQYYKRWNSTTVKYYVEGIGLWETDFVRKNPKTLKLETLKFETFDGLDYSSPDQ
jgi:hypothetical protein